MKNKLILTALAAAIVAPGVASATDVTVGGIVEVYLKQTDNGGDLDDTLTVESGDVRIAVKAEETKGDYTGYASYRIDADGLSGTGLTADSIAVGIKGGFGDFTMGEVTATEHGQFANDIYDYLGDTEAHLGYKNTFGPVGVALAWSPEDSDDHIGLGVEGTFGPVTVGAATNTFGDNSGDYNSNIIGAKASLGPVTLAAHLYDKGDYTPGTVTIVDDGTNTTTSVNAEEEISGYAVQANGDVANWSWKVTYASEDYTALAASTTVVNATDALLSSSSSDDDYSRTTTRLDLGTSLMDVVGFSVRYEIEDDEALDDTTSFIRAGLTMEF